MSGAEINLEGRVALVTGGGRGLGRSHALELAARGASVVVNDLGCGLFGEGADASVAAEVVGEIEAAGGRALANTLTIDRPENARAMVREAVDAFGRLDIVVNNAGFLRRRPFLEHTPEMVRDILSVHVLGSYFVSQAAFEVMLEQEYGRIVFTSSPGGTRGNPWVTAYGAAKGGVIGLAQAVALAGEPHGIRANVISPYANTRMADAMETRSPEEELGQHRELMEGRARLPARLGGSGLSRVGGVRPQPRDPDRGRRARGALGNRDRRRLPGVLRRAADARDGARPASRHPRSVPGHSPHLERPGGQRLPGPGGTGRHGPCGQVELSASQVLACWPASKRPRA